MPVKAVTFDLWQTLIFDSKELEEYRRLRRLMNFYRFTNKILPKHYHEDSKQLIDKKIQLGQVRQALEEMQSRLQILHREGYDVSPRDRGKMLFEMIGLKFKPESTSEIYEKAGRILSNSGYGSGFPNINPEALPAMEALKKRFPNLKIALVSNAARSAAAYEKILKALGIGKYFDDLVISCEIGFVKPRKEIFEQAIRLLAADPVEMLHIGDLFQADVIGATSCGMNACLYTGLWEKYAQYKNPKIKIPNGFRSQHAGLIIEEIQNLEQAVQVAAKIR